MSLHLDYADENFRDAWIASANDPAVVKALVIGGRALVRSGRQFEQLADQVQQLKREVARLRAPDLGNSGASRVLEQVRDERIVTTECERCKGSGTVCSPNEFGEKSLAGHTAALEDRAGQAKARDLDDEPLEENCCPGCDGSGRQPVSLTSSEYELLRRQDDGAFIALDPPTFIDLVQNPRRVAELSNRELLEISRQDHRDLLIRSLQQGYREVRREYANSIRAVQIRHQSGDWTVSDHNRQHRPIESLLAEGKRLETAVTLLHHELARDASSPGVTASLAPEL